MGAGHHKDHAGIRLEFSAPPPHSREGRRAENGDDDPPCQPKKASIKVGRASGPNTWRYGENTCLERAWTLHTPSHTPCPKHPLHGLVVVGILYHILL